MKIPSAFGYYPVSIGLGANGGDNPGKLGEVLKKMIGEPGITVNKYGTNAPSKSHGCP